jgi:hypothetical protein
MPVTTISTIGAILAILIFQPRALAEADQSKEHQLKGGVEFSDTPAATKTVTDVAGTWKGHVIEFRRHPTVLISEQNGNEIKGTYSGLLGKFPLSGVLDETAGTIQLSIDFSKSSLARWKKRKHAIAVFNGFLKDEFISGTASFPEFGERMVHFEAHKQPKVGMSKSTTDQSLQ